MHSFDLLVILARVFLGVVGVVMLAHFVAMAGYLKRSPRVVLPVLGADPGAMTPVRLTRLPGCTRGGRLQELIYLNPRPNVRKPVLIRDLPKLRGVALSRSRSAAE